MTAVYRYPDGAHAVELATGALLVVHPDGATDERFTVGGFEVELLDPDDGLDEILGRVRDALADVKMSKTARAAVADALDGLGSAES